MNWLILLPAIAFAILIIGTPIALWIEFRSAIANHRFRRSVDRRQSRSDKEFIAAYYGSTEIPPDIPLRLRPIYGTYFELDPTKIHPSDLPPDIFDFDTQPLMDAIEKEFGITIDDAEQERTIGEFDAIVNCVFRITRKNDTMLLGL